MTDYDNISYLEFEHEVVVFDNEVFGIYIGQDGIKSIRGDTNIITHEDGRTEDISWGCVREWSHVED